MNHLQNRLDQLHHPNFDKEALWMKINRPKPQKRFLLGWISGISLLIILFFAGLLWTIPLAPTTSFFPIPHQGKAPSAQVIALKETQALSIFPPAVNSKQEFNTKPKKKVTLSKSNITPSLKTQKSTFNKINNTQTTFDSKSNSSPAPKTNKISSQSPISPTQQLTSTITQKVISPLPTLNSSPKTPTNPISLPTITKPLLARRSRRFPKNEIIVTVGSQVHFHQLDKAACDYHKEKPDFPALYTSVQFKRNLTPKYYLLADLTYSYTQSNVRASITELKQFFDTQDGGTLLETTTTYQFYNQYHRLDFSIGAGYTWALDEQQFHIDASFGGAKWLAINGNHLNQKGERFELPKAADVPIAPFAKINAAWSRTLANNFSIGLQLSAQTPIKVSPPNDNCQHRVWPIYLGLRLGKAL